MEVYLLMTRPNSFKIGQVRGVFSTRNAAVDAAKENGLYSDSWEVEVFKLEVDGEVINDHLQLSNFKID